VTNSIQKGKRGEREFCKEVLIPAGYNDARRGVQYKGGPDSPDIDCKSLSSLHFEVKRVERLSLEKALSQAITDAGDKIPVVASKKNRGEWIISLRASDFMRIVKGD